MYFKWKNVKSLDCENKESIKDTSAPSFHTFLHNSPTLAVGRPPTSQTLNTTNPEERNPLFSVALGQDPESVFDKTVGFCCC